MEAKVNKIWSSPYLSRIGWLLRIFPSWGGTMRGKNRSISAGGWLAILLLAPGYISAEDIEKIALKDGRALTGVVEPTEGGSLRIRLWSRDRFIGAVIVRPDDVESRAVIGRVPGTEPPLDAVDLLEGTNLDDSYQQKIRELEEAIYQAELRVLEAQEHLTDAKAQRDQRIIGIGMPYARQWLESIADKVPVELTEEALLGKANTANEVRHGMAVRRIWEGWRSMITNSRHQIPNERLARFSEYISRQLVQHAEILHAYELLDWSAIPITETEDLQRVFLFLAHEYRDEGRLAREQELGRIRAEEERLRARAQIRADIEKRRREREAAHEERQRNRQVIRLGETGKAN